MTTRDPSQQRRAWMEQHLTQAAHHFGVRAIGRYVHTERHHSIGAEVDTGNDRAWLRVVYDDPEWANGSSYLQGNITANDIDGVPKPHIQQWHEWDDHGRKLRGELSTYIPDRPIVPAMILTTEPQLADTWLAQLRTALDSLATHPTPRQGLDPDDLNNGIRAFFGIDIDTATVPWTTAHCDLHWGNITAPNLHILDWEIWGKAPAGYDAATLHCTSLLAPRTAHRIHDALSHHLDTPAGRIAALAVAVRFLRFADDGDYLPLAHPLRQHAQAIAATY